MTSFMALSSAAAAAFARLFLAAAQAKRTKDEGLPSNEKDDKESWAEIVGALGPPI
ncbi:MAG: hypothetical protein JSR72_00545 [Proteobacteria bacterium]|nr:hypothetical protein [Pseudomonadota bacterium]